MRRNKKGAALKSVAIAGIAVLVLLLAGALLRMHTKDLGFFDALGSFVKDTFHAGA